MKRSLLLFDLENQRDKIEELKAWNVDANIEFKGYSIKSSGQLLDTTGFDQFIILLGRSTKYLSAQFYRDLESIISTTKPILCLNLNGFVALEKDICPIILQDVGAVHMAFSRQDLTLSLSYIKHNARIDNPSGSYHYRKDQRSYLDE